MYSDTNTTRSVADAVMKVMNEKLHPNQQKLDVHEPEKDELTADDFKKLRAGKKANEVKKEEAELNLEDFSLEEFEEFMISEEFQQLDELSKKTIGSYVKKASDDAAMQAGASTGWAHTSSNARNPRVKAAAAKYSDEADTKRQKRLGGIGKAVKRLTKEEVQQILEYESKDGKFVHNAKAGRYGGSEKPTDPFAGVRGPGKKDIEKIEKEKKKKKFSEMVATYQEEGLKSLKEMFIKEEPTNDEYKKELEDVKAKASGAKTNPDIAKGKVDAVKQEEVETEAEVIEEKTMTEPEMKKREEIVKSMKKNISGFKERYGDRAKSVMYATATKQAMKEETESEHYKAGHEYASDHAQDSGFKVTARARKKEMLADNPHKKGTTEHSDWHRGALAGHQTALDNM